MEPKQEAKKAACDVKAKLVKLAGGTAAHLPRGRGGWPWLLPVLFQQLFRPQHRFFVTFFTEESNVFSSSALSRQKLLPLPPPPWLEPPLLLKVLWLLLLLKVLWLLPPEEGGSFSILWRTVVVYR
mgnify:CR=1 FL=1